MSDHPRPSTTKDSGKHGIPVPGTSQRIDDAGDGYRVSGSTMQELTVAYKDWMSTDVRIFDAAYRHR